MKLAVRKWGNSASVRLPASLMAAAHLSLDQMVDVREEDGRIIIEPIREAAIDLAELVSGITDDNQHSEITFGATAGNEIW